MFIQARARLASSMAGFSAVTVACQTFTLPTLLSPFLRLALVSEIQ
jgi:hypothetical protein